MKRLISAVLVAFIAGSPFIALAQEAPSMLPAGSGDSTPELQSCFEYYRFGSVPVTVSSETLRIAQGAPLTLHATITNENAYPVDDIKVFSKVFYKKNFDKSSYGPDVVDWFTLADHVKLKAGEVKTITYNWNVPAGIEPGSYQIASYVISHDRFNMAGLSFSNDVVGNLFNFSIAGDDLGAARFDNTQIVLNGVGFHAAIFPPTSSVTETGVPLTAVISNTSGKIYVGQINWKLYSWDSTNPDNLIKESTQDVAIQPHASTTVTYSVSDTDHTVYYIVGTLSAGDNTPKSILTVRYISPSDDNTDTPRIAFVGTTGYPSVAGETKAFACLHSTGRSATKDIRYELSVAPLDPLTWIRTFGRLGSYTYKGTAPGAISAISVAIGKNAGSFAVTARLYQDNKLIDQVTTDYSCEDFGTKCSPISWLVVSIASLILAVLAYVGLKMMHRRDAVTPPTE